MKVLSVQKSEKLNNGMTKEIVLNVPIGPGYSPEQVAKKWEEERKKNIERSIKEPDSWKAWTVDNEPSSSNIYQKTMVWYER